MKLKFRNVNTEGNNLEVSRILMVFKVVELYKKELEEKKKIKSEPKPKTKPVSTNDSDSSPVVKPIPKPVDVFAPLQETLSPKEVWLVRRVFKSFSDNCPEANKKLIEELKIMVVKDLAKK